MPIAFSASHGMDRERCPERATNQPACSSTRQKDWAFSGTCQNPSAKDGGEEMKKTLKATGWFFLSIDTVAFLFFLNWALTASTRDGEVAYAFFFLLFTLAFIGVGGGALVFSARRGSVLGLWCSTLFLGLPPVIVAAIRISNSL
ncbi:hypothetical protein [Synechococcus sp. CS-1332]|uniref:hypothetical protein n=1 Tax=Synechococcus sp. CS-1332 TaxID=2847972 RepID=UPI00223C11FC|nr:hypothetical protein [Synechococcus sp. CS-1332]MCT0207003.1 hypothetical protein [Synechococcus sp. CS-1332]